MTPELLPCPFCGHAAHLVHDTSSDYERHWSWGAECINFDECEAGLTGFASAETAATKWNSRKMTYARRNGETTSPSAPGKYWFRGTVIICDVELITDVFVDSNGVMWAFLDDVNAYEPITAWRGQWWGPVVAPWEVGA